MQQIADFHIHSKYSRACSPELTLKNIEQTCRNKGVDIIGTGDFTYPDWFDSIKNELEEINQSGLYCLKNAIDEKVKFILTTEIALIYKKFDQCRRVHMVLHAPNIEAVQKLNNFLDKDYNIRSDGRPILGMSIEKLIDICLKIHPQFLIYPAHIWTPWFAIFGSKSGFNSLEECFGNHLEHIYAYETGLSSDPPMNWQVSELDSLTLLSNSDAHSLPNIAREATVFDFEEISYQEIYQVIKNKEIKKIKYTIEFYPEEGMYHLDGHRNCEVCFTPQESKKNKGICPKCKKPLILGVNYRVAELADRKYAYKPKNAAGFKKLVELDKIIAEVLKIKNRKAKKVQAVYQNMIQNIGTELDILMQIPIDEIENVSGALIAEGINRMRNSKLKIKAGFDGQYGVVKIFDEKELKNNQKSLF